MPEGDTILRAARRLHTAMAGREITRFEASASRLLNVERVGRTVVAVRARGKHLLMDFDDGMILHSHLRMRGAVEGDSPMDVADRSFVGGDGSSVQERWFWVWTWRSRNC